jgi:hypothetical protein
MMAEISDPEGARVVLDRAVWVEKIVCAHPEISGHLDDVLEAVAIPDWIAPDPSFQARKRYYRRDMGPSQWLLVVVRYEQVPARIISAFASRKDPRSWSE